MLFFICLTDIVAYQYFVSVDVFVRVTFATSPPLRPCLQKTFLPHKISKSLLYLLSCYLFPASSVTLLIRTPTWYDLLNPLSEN